MIYLVRGHALLAVVSVATILGDFIPITLANVPFNNSITYVTFDVCTWISVGILAFMLVILFVVTVVIISRSSTLNFPFTARSWGTLAAVLYLVCRSYEYLAQLHGLSVAEKIGNDTRTEIQNTRYSIVQETDDGGKTYLKIQAE